ncbi:unnamed protein product [Arabidopsis thaliana]|uniref:(thale cress) hypothetical protein n=1 Tax=Arabidopsis thaliana TaxID=3702 RepID=A0A7G2FI96_ARATH|nr:unnamed protein product [Arabidopsis thaliana]
MAEHDFSLKETCPKIGGRRSIPGGDMLTSSFDLVERMTFLYIRIVKARALPSNDLFVEVTIGRYKGRTKRSTNPYPNLEFDEVFAFNSDRLQGNMLEVTMKMNEEEIIGQCRFEVAEIPTRIPPDSPLAPQWDRLEDRTGNRFGGEVMVSVWMGTQADEFFPEAWHSDSATVTGENVVIVRSKVYLSLRLWYLRVNVIEAQDLVLLQGNRTNPEILVKGFLGNVVVRSRVSQSRTMSPAWNEDMMFVAVEPLRDGYCRDLYRLYGTTWSALDGGYHVLDESIQYSSDYRASAKLLWTPTIGVLELGVISASGLIPMKSRDGRGTTDAYYVAKYGQKWVRTRTIVDSLSPKWNEQYTWEVYDPYTVITIAVFDNLHLLVPGNTNGARDSKYCLRHQATHILCLKLGRSEPPLGRDVIEYMLDFGSNIWSLRRGRANFERILSKADSALPDELDEEFDGFPSAKSADLVKRRYDRLRGIAGRMMMVLGDLATQGERVKNLLSWRDPRATFLFSMFCLVACGVIFLVSMKLLMTLLAFYVMRHPRLRVFDISSVPQNFFRRLPSRADSML